MIQILLIPDHPTVARIKWRRCRGSNPGHSHDRREYLPLYYNKPFENLMAKYGVKHRVATPYHPQTSGQVELANR